MSAIRVLILAFGLTVGLCASADDTPYNKGVEAWRVKNYVEARLQWERSLAEGGPDEALNNLAFLLYHGQGGPIDRPKAVELWRKGAALAVSEAQVHLGNAYEEGGGIKASLVHAYAWYKCSVVTAGRRSKNDQTERAIELMAAKALAKLSLNLTAAERAEGQRLSEELVAKYSVPLHVGKP